MTPDTAAAGRIENLLAHREWVRRLARSLATTAADADDVEQQTWLAAISSAPTEPRSLRGWLTTVARNAARKLGREHSRRRRRDAALPPPGSARSAAELAGEAEAHALVAAAVAALDEPYREAILLRYFEGLDVGLSAARAGVPLETMRARLRRARVRLRAALGDGGPSDDRAMSAIAPLIGPVDEPGFARGCVAGAGVGGVAAGGGIVVTKAVACAAALLIAGAVVWWGTSGTAELPESARLRSPATSGSAPEPEKPVRTRIEADGTPALPGARPAAATADVAPSASRRPAADRVDEIVPVFELTGPDALAQYARVAQVTGLRVFISPRAKAALPAKASGLELWGKPPRLLLDVLTATHGVGWRVERDRIEIVATDGAAEDPASFVEVPPAEPLPEIVIRGTVRRAGGEAAGGASVLQWHPEWRVVAKRTTTAPDGTFELRVRPSLGTLVATLRGSAQSPPWSVPAASPVGEPVLALGGAAGDVVLRLLTDSGAAVGAVVDPFGGGVNGTETTGVDGTARFFDFAEGPCSFRVSLAGHQPATARCDVVAGRTTEVEVRLAVVETLARRLASARVRADFKDARLADVVGFFASVHAVNVVVDPHLTEAAAGKPVTVRFSGESLADALRVLALEVGAEVLVDERAGVVHLRATAR